MTERNPRPRIPRELAGMGFKSPRNFIFEHRQEVTENIQRIMRGREYEMRNDKDREWLLRNVPELTAWAHLTHNVLFQY